MYPSSRDSFWQFIYNIYINIYIYSKTLKYIQSYPHERIQNLDFHLCSLNNFTSGCLIQFAESRWQSGSHPGLQAACPCPPWSQETSLPSPIPVPSPGGISPHSRAPICTSHYTLMEPSTFAPGGGRLVSDLRAQTSSNRRLIKFQHTAREK